MLSLVVAAVSSGVLLWWLTRPATDERAGLDHAARSTGAESVATRPALTGAAGAAPEVPLPDAAQPLAPPADATVADAANAPATGTLVVQVRWKADGSPAADIGLRLLELDQRDPLFHALDGRTDSSGQWIAKDRPPGRVVVYSDRVEAQAGRLAAGQRTELLIELPPGVLVRGAVVDGEQRPVAGADIWLDGSTSPGVLASVGRADNLGRFVLRDVRRGQGVGASAPEHTRSWAVVLEQSTPDPFDLVLELGPPGGRVQGIVAGPDGRPVAGATVLVGAESGFPPAERRPPDHVRWPPPLRVLTDEAGAFGVDDVPARGVPVAVRATGWSPWAGFTTVKAGATSEVAVALQPSASVTGVVRDEAGQTLADAHVSTEGGGQMTLQFDFSDDEGRFTLRDLPLGRTDLNANRDGVGRAATTLTVEPGGQYTWDPVLGAGLLIRGRVVDERGAALAGMGINAVPQEGDQSNHRTKTDAEGRFTLDNCADAPHRLEVDATAAASPFALTTLSGVRPGPDELEIVVAAGAASAFVVGRVDDERGAPLGGAKVFLSQSATQRALDARTEAASGAFRFGPLPAGRYALEVEAPDRPGLSVPEFELAAGELRDLGTLAFERTGTLLVRATVPEGVDAASVGGAAFPTAGGSGAMLERQPDGTLLSPPLQPGEYRVRVWALRAAMQTLTAQVAADGRAELDVALVGCHWHIVTLRLSWHEEPAPSVAVEIRDRDGALVFDARPEVEDVAAEHSRRALVSACLPPADYVLQVSRDGERVLEVPLLLATATGNGRSEFELP